MKQNFILDGMAVPFDPTEALAITRHEFGEHGGVNPSIEASSTFTVMHPETMPGLFAGRRGPAQGCYLYGRHFNPTVYALGRYLAAMESTEAAYATASGISAIASALIQLCGTGDHIVASQAIYGGTFALLSRFLPRRAGVHTTFVDAADPAAVAAAMTDRTRAVFVETVSNPTLTVADLPRLADVAHSRGAVLVVDNTFCPLAVTPARHGADIVVHSLTKFISGASDVIAGAICASESFVRELMDVEDGALMLLGPTMDPSIAHRLSLRLPHLGLRMREHARRAQVFAERLLELGVAVRYPGLSTHPQQALLARQANDGYGAGGLLTIDFGTEARAHAVLDRLQNEVRFGFIAVSLGYFDTLMSCSASSTSSELPADARDAAGISPGLVRMSIGYTGSLEQRWGQLHSALRAAGVVAERAQVGSTP